MAARLAALALPNHTIYLSPDGREKFGPSTWWRLEAQRPCLFNGHLPGRVTLNSQRTPTERVKHPMCFSDCKPYQYVYAVISACVLRVGEKVQLKFSLSLL
jgi:hypothetical protein